MGRFLLYSSKGLTYTGIFLLFWSNPVGAVMTCLFLVLGKVEKRAWLDTSVFVSLLAAALGYWKFLHYPQGLGQALSMFMIFLFGFTLGGYLAWKKAGKPEDWTIC